MFDLNNIISAAIQQAVSHAVAQSFAPIIARLDRLENIVAEFSPAQQAVAAADFDSDAFRTAVKRIAEAEAERAMEAHNEEYPHDDYDEAANDIDKMELDEYVKKDDLHDKVSDLLNNATISL